MEEVNPYFQCPYCKSDKVTAEIYDTPYVYMFCSNCGKTYSVNPNWVFEENKKEKHGIKRD